MYVFYVSEARADNPEIYLRGLPLDIGGGGGWSFCLAISFYFTDQGRWKAMFPSPQDRLYFHHALWPFIYFTHFPHKNIYFQRTPPPPPPRILISPPPQILFYFTAWCWLPYGVPSSSFSHQDVVTGKDESGKKYE